MRVDIFIDDFTRDKDANSPSSVISKAFGCYAALVPAVSRAPLDAALVGLLERCRQKAGPLAELHGREMLGHKTNWGNLLVAERAEVIASALRLADRFGVTYVYEIRQVGDPAMARVLDRIQEAYPDRAERWNDPELALATLVRRASALEAFAAGADESLLVEDREIARDDELDRRFLTECEKYQLKIEHRPRQDSDQWPGLQLADLAGTTMGLRMKILDRRDLYREQGKELTENEIDTFSRALAGEGVMQLIMEKSVRALDRNWKKEAERVRAQSKNASRAEEG